MKISLGFGLIFCLVAWSELSIAQTLRPSIGASKTEKEMTSKDVLGGLSLSQLIQAGLKYSPEIQKSEASLKISEEDYSQVESAIFPTVLARASARNRKLALANFGQSAGTLKQNIYDATLEASQPLYVGGAITSGLAEAKVAKQAAEQERLIQKQQYLFELIGAYYDYSENFEKLKQAKINRDFLSNYAGIAKRYASIGRTKSIDRLQAEANLASAESTILEFETNLESQKDKLLQLVGMNGSRDEINIQSSVEVQPIAPMKVEEALEKALEGNPDLKKASLELKRQKHLNDLNLIEHRPRVTLEGSYGYTSPNRDEWFEENRNTYTVGVNLVVPLFSGLSSLSKKRANAQFSYQKEKDLALKQDELRVSISTAIQTLDRDFRRIKSLKLAADLGRRAMDSALVDYRRGLVSSTDVVAIQNNRFQSEVKLVQASVSYMKQVLSLRRDLGIELESAY